MDRQTQLDKISLMQIGAVTYQLQGFSLIAVLQMRDAAVPNRGASG